MPQCQECAFYHEAPFTRRPLCRATYRDITKTVGLMVCRRFSAKPVPPQPATAASPAPICSSSPTHPSN